MVKVTPITKYSEMSDEALKAEALRLRYEVENPQLRKRDHLMNLFLSIIGAGTTVSTAAGLGYMIAKPPKHELGAKSINEYFKSRWGKDKTTFEKYRAEDPHFVKALNITVSAFALATAVSIPIINQIQKKETAEDNATKLSHAERILKERGYVVGEGVGNYVKPHRAAIDSPEPGQGRINSNSSSSASQRTSMSL